MPLNQPTILAVAPGRSRLGIAVFSAGSLIYYGGKSLRQYRSEAGVLEAAERFLGNTFESYRITHLAITELNKQQRRSVPLAALCRHIKTFADGNSVPVFEYNALFIRGQLCRSEKATRENAARRLIEKHLELSKYLRGISEWERRYYGYVFDAIALGGTCVRQMTDRAGKKYPAEY